MSHEAPISAWLSRRDIKIHILLSLAVAIVLLIEFVFAQNMLFFFPDKIDRITRDIFFLGSIHISFSVLLILFHPKFRLKTHLLISKRKIFCICSLVAIVAVFLLFLLEFLSPALQRLVILFSILVPTYHVLSQTAGLSLSFFENKENKNIIKKIWLVANIFFIMSYGRSQFGFPIPPIYFHSCCFLVYIFLFISSVYFLKKEGKLGQTHIFFQMRGLLLPLIAITPSGMFFFSSLHGLEYASVTSHQFKNESARKDHLFWRILVLGIGIVAVLVFISTYAEPSSWFRAIGISFLMAFTTLHYIADSFLFRSSS